MVISLNSPGDLKRFIEALADDLATAHQHYRLFRDLHWEANEFLAELNSTPAFWHLTNRAQIETSLVRLCKVYDQDEKSFSLVNFLDTVRARLEWFDRAHYQARLKDNASVESLVASWRAPTPSQIVNDRLKVTSATDSRVKNLMIWRGNYYAHRSPAYTSDPETFASKWPLLYTNIESLIDDGMRIVNDYSALFDAHVHSRSLLGESDFRTILKILRAHRLAVAESFKREAAKYGGDVND